MFQESAVKKLFLGDSFFILLFFSLFGFFRTDIVLLIVLACLLPYLFFTRRLSLLRHLYVAGGISFIWVLIARGKYTYNQDFIEILGINLFVYLGWTLGLLALYVIYSHVEGIFKFKGYKRAILYSSLYWILLISAEKIAYSYFNIKNLAAASYSTLPICSCLHAEIWMQIVYLAMGPVYISICYLLKLENPHMARIKA